MFSILCNIICVSMGLILYLQQWCMDPQGGGGGTLIFSYIRRLGSLSWVQNFKFQYSFGFQKNKYFFRYEDFMDIFWGSSQNLTIFRGHFYAFKGLF